MKDKWVTLAIRTYQRALRIKNLLDSHEIETIIHNLNEENPEIAVGVRVRIREKDLPQALSIVEKMEKAWDEEINKDKPFIGKTILIPIELSDQINLVCEYGFHYAKKLNAKVVFLHAFLTPAYTITASSTTDINTYSLTDTETIRRIIKTNNADVENLSNLIKKWIDEGRIPKVDFQFELREGVPEEEILDYVKRHNPALIIMGSNSRNKQSDTYIGSVTAEVMETSLTPVLVVPGDTELKAKEIKRIAFLTNFDQKDLIAVDTIISFFKENDLEIVFIHSADKKTEWDEVMITGLKEYFASKYPNVKTAYALLDNREDIESIKPYLESSKIDVIAMNTKKRSMFVRLFSQGLATKLMFNTDTPLFVMHY